VASKDRVTATEIVPNFWRVETRYGFMERPNIPEVLRSSKALGCTIELDDVTYYVGHETIVSREDKKGLPGWQEIPFALMQRNAVHVSDFFSLPNDKVVEIGRQISI
jgi:KUP system potassium uptake protein